MNQLLHRSLIRWSISVLAVAGLLSCAASAATPDDSPSFIRYVAGPEAQVGRVETAIKTYRHPNGATVTLLAAVHIADGAYYRELQRRFAAIAIVDHARSPGRFQPGF